MPTQQDWIKIIRSHNGKIGGGEKNHRHPMLGVNYTNKYAWIDAYWIYKNPGDDAYKKVRDSIAREMRKDGWDVTVGMTNNRLEYHLFANRIKKWYPDGNGGLKTDDY